MTQAILQITGLLCTIIGVPWLMWDKRASTAAWISVVGLICFVAGGGLD